MNNFEYINEIYEIEIELMIKSMTKEISILTNLKKKLVQYAYSQSVKGKIIFLDYKSIISEAERMAIEINFLEEKRLEYIRLKEKQENK